MSTKLYRSVSYQQPTCPPCIQKAASQTKQESYQSSDVDVFSSPVVLVQVAWVLGKPWFLTFDYNQQAQT